MVVPPNRRSRLKATRRAGPNPRAWANGLIAESSTNEGDQDRVLLDHPHHFAIGNDREKGYLMR